MLTLGIDLASAAANTAYCTLEWDSDRATVAELATGASDATLLAAHRCADAIGIDCPFGWPEAFRRLVAGQPPDAPWSTDRRDELRYRLTDHHVRRTVGRWPLSVSSDLIAVPAMRCQLLLHAMGVTDRSGDGRVWEVYPAASLRIWGFRPIGYKRRAGRAVLKKLAASLRYRISWLRLPDPSHAALLAECDDALDALVASLTAAAAKLGLTERPDSEAREIAAREGWIALPIPGSLDRLPTS